MQASAGQVWALSCFPYRQNIIVLSFETLLVSKRAYLWRLVGSLKLFDIFAHCLVCQCLNRLLICNKANHQASSVNPISNYLSYCHISQAGWFALQDCLGSYSIATTCFKLDFYFKIQFLLVWRRDVTALCPVLWVWGEEWVWQSPELDWSLQCQWRYVLLGTEPIGLFWCSVLDKSNHSTNLILFNAKVACFAASIWIGFNYVTFQDAVQEVCSCFIQSGGCLTVNRPARARFATQLTLDPINYFNYLPVSASPFTPFVMVGQLAVGCAKSN